MPVFVERFVLPSLAALVIIVAVTNPLGLSIRDRLILTPIILGLAGFAAYLVHRAQQPTRRRTPESTSERTYVDISPRYLTRLYRKNSTLQADKLMEPYKDHWIRVRGRLYNVVHNGRTLAAFIHFGGSSPLEDPRPYCFLLFKENWLGRLAAIKMGKKITVDGRLVDASTKSIQLEECKLVDE